MPNKDGTGPEGKGSQTGRKKGNCQDSVKRGQGRGNGNGQGRGAGRCCSRLLDE